MSAVIFGCLLAAELAPKLLVAPLVGLAIACLGLLAVGLWIRSTRTGLWLIWRDICLMSESNTLRPDKQESQRLGDNHVEWKGNWDPDDLAGQLMIMAMAGSIVGRFFVNDWPLIPVVGLFASIAAALVTHIRASEVTFRLDCDPEIRILELRVGKKVTLSAALNRCTLEIRRDRFEMLVRSDAAGSDSRLILRRCHAPAEIGMAVVALLQWGARGHLPS